VVRERIPQIPVFALCIPEPTDENIQQPTSNIEHPRADARTTDERWVMNAGCWMFLGFMGREAHARRP